jgi:hypothetical protein
MDLGIKGKVALITASSRGLGRAVAEELAAEGANLVLCARSESTLGETAEAIRKSSSGVKVVSVVADISDPAAVERVWNSARDEFGRVDILVNNAGGPPAGPFEAHSPSAWDDAWRLTFESAVNMTRSILPGMKQRLWGRIINITCRWPDPLEQRESGGHRLRAYAGERSRDLRSDREQRDARLYTYGSHRASRGEQRDAPRYDSRIGNRRDGVADPHAPARNTA